MKTFFSCLALCLFLLPLSSRAAETAGDKPKSTRARSLIGSPVNPNLAASGTVPKGIFVSMLNASFADKNRSKKGGKTDTFNQTWLLKLRYGVTETFEIALVTPYINNSRSGSYSGSKHIEGFGDEGLQFTFGPLQERLGDPFTFSFAAGLSLPTGTGGKNHLPGSGAWGWRTVVSAGKWLNKNLKLDTEGIWSGPFERGNQKVKGGQALQWNAQARYMLDNIDFALESNLYHQESGDKNTPGGNINLRNGATEWLVGPSMNVASDTLGMWAGIGVFFPVMQDVKGPTAVEDARFAFKIGKVW